MESIDRRSLWIGLGIGAVYLVFGFWRTIMFLLLVGAGYVVSHPVIRERVLLPLWVSFLGWADRWRSRL